MAAELRITLPTISYGKNAVSINIVPPVNPLLVDVAGENSMHDVLTLSTSNTAISKGNISSIGYVFFKNIDPTNNILIGSDGTTYPMMLKPGEYAFFRSNLSGALFQAKAAAGTPILEYSYIEA
jgi:hypothetical protein